ncbi:MAG: bifunctional proline dehydrogenase/L-glutamate gamma-semialdehyde dehydrogenase PutA [Rickettsiaceae bacterium]|nr:bifunctional proline dehydrogenase/L-glutamate gamma-semialdehyde dehydrogenase PutA [Rickettsiaceae bacterium]
MNNNIINNKINNQFNNSENESEIIKKLLPQFKFYDAETELIIANTEKYIQLIRDHKGFSIEEFINRFSLSSDEGLAVICLAEGLLRIPDNTISNSLAIDKLSHKNWLQYLFKGNQSLRTIFTSFGLYMFGKYTDVIESQNVVTNLVRRIGQPAFIKILKTVILRLSKEFIFAEDIYDAVDRTGKYEDYKFSFDLLGESSRTMVDADRYFQEYQKMIKYISKSYQDKSSDLFERPNISVKLTALYPRFELTKFADLEKKLMPKIVALVKEVRNNNLTITFDAEESFRLDAYMLFLSKLIAKPEFKGFNGIGLVLQSYNVRSYQLLDQIIDLTKKHKKIIPVRLTKGAYWDSEIKHAQELGLKSYPVFTKKEYTDANYIACARKMLANNDYIFPQFATHNALTAATILQLGKDKNFELQKLFGMGDKLHQELLAKTKNVRIYAPVGKSNDLIAYLMRRMLENGAGNSFIHKIHNKETPVEELAYNLHDRVLNLLDTSNTIILPENIYKDRKNAMGYDLGYKTNYDYIKEKVASYYNKTYKIGSIIDGIEINNTRKTTETFCPGKFAEKFSTVAIISEKEINKSIDSATREFTKWTNIDVDKRSRIVENIAINIEKHKFELYALLIKEAGKTIHDAINEVIEAIDFCRYYALQAKKVMQEIELPGITGESNLLTMHGRGVFACISPWNFPLAIFTGQIVAALVSGNTVIAKPASQTPVIANFMVKLMRSSGIPKSALQLIICSGNNFNKFVVTDSRIAGVAFTGSCQTAKLINNTLANNNPSIVPLIAETGGQNAMIVDSSALIEQVCDDILISAFYSAGQRCSALRVVYIQEEIYKPLLDMIKSATELLQISDTVDFSTDIGPVIDKTSYDVLISHIENMQKKGFKVFTHPQKGGTKGGHYFYPHIIEINSINDIENENFGPVLHVIKYKTKKIDKVIDEINNYGYGLTFGIHSRIEEKIEYLRNKIKAGNIYANRSIVGAKVESQPFGGENKSGTGFKAGGPNYLLKFMLERTTSINLTAIGGNVDLLTE